MLKFSTKSHKSFSVSTIIYDLKLVPTYLNDELFEIGSYFWRNRE